MCIFSHIAFLFCNFLKSTNNTNNHLLILRNPQNIHQKN